MNAFVLLMIAGVMTSGYLVDQGLLPPIAKYLPEILGAIALLAVVAYGTRNRFQYVRPAYWFAFGAVALIMVCGALANSLESGPVFTGLRKYLRAVPFFFLPAVYAFNERQIRNQLRLVLVLCLVQLPIAIGQRQRGLWYSDKSGDFVSGTLLGSGMLSIFLISASCILTAKVLRREIKWVLFLPLFLCLLAPTMINETKVTVILLPVGILTTFIAGSKRGVRLKNVIVATSLLAIFGSIFVPVYDYYIAKTKYGTPIVEFFSEKKKFESYLGKGADIGSPKARRSDALIVPLIEMSRDPVHLAFGLGIGNASDSALGQAFTGKYFRKFEPFLQTAASVFILEIGLLGLSLVLVIDFLIYRDSRVVADAGDSAMGSLAVGWAGVTAVIVAATFYAPLTTSEAISYLFWFFSGLIAAQRVRLSGPSP